MSSTEQRRVFVLLKTLKCRSVRISQTVATATSALISFTAARLTVTSCISSSETVNPNPSRSCFLVLWQLQGRGLVTEFECNYKTNNAFFWRLSRWMGEISVTIQLPCKVSRALSVLKCSKRSFKINVSELEVCATQLLCNVTAFQPSFPFGLCWPTLRPEKSVFNHSGTWIK